MEKDDALFSFSVPQEQAAAQQRQTRTNTPQSLADRPITSLANEIYDHQRSTGSGVTPAAAYALAARYKHSTGSGSGAGSPLPISPQTRHTSALSHGESIPQTGSTRADASLDEEALAGIDQSPRVGYARGHSSQMGPMYGSTEQFQDTGFPDTGSAHTKLYIAPSDDEKGISSPIPMTLDEPFGFDDPFGLGDQWEEEEDSPYPEVRASVSNLDDPDMPALTFRVWAIGLTLSLVVSAANTFLYFRYPAPSLSPVLVQLVSYPIGKLLAEALPISTFSTPRGLRWMLGEEWSFNPGPWNIKEHATVLIMTGASAYPSYGINAIVAAEKFYGFKTSFGLKVCLVLSQQLIGFGIAGLVRRFLVWPAGLIWPQTLVYCTLLNTLHAEDHIEQDGGTNRLHYFFWVFGAAFAYWFLPGFLFTALSSFSFICWIWPQNVVVNQLFGVASGLGMSMVTLDWSMISYIGSPLIVPWFVIANVFAGFVLAFWIIAPALYYTNTLFTSYLPISTSAVFDRFGAPYNTTMVLDASGSLDLAAYDNYSPLYLPVTYFLSYGLEMAVASACLVHTGLHHGKEMIDYLRGLGKVREDVHMKLMRRYPEVPFWWYLVSFVIFGGLSLATVLAFPLETPVWALLVAVAFATLYVVPAGLLFAIGNQQIGINVLVQMIGGYMLPGRAIGNMIFKGYTISTLAGSLQFTQDLKIGHYVKVPPRVTFAVQFAVTILATFVQVGITEGLFRSVDDLCDSRQSANLICPSAQVYYSSSITWGLIGPSRLFGVGKTYHNLLWALLIGAALPLPFWLLARKYPRKWYRLVNIPLLLNGATLVPPATGINFSSWFALGFIFQYVIRKRAFVWWSRFTYLTSAALDSGTVLCAVVIFLSLQLPKGGTIALDWWGNNVYMNTADWAGVSYKMAPAEGFGPSTW